MKFRALTCTAAMTLFVALGLAGNAHAQTFASLDSFDRTDGSNPYAGLVQATNGNLYGTTRGGGANLDGTIFAVSPVGTLTTLHGFDSTDGSSVYAGLVQASDGNFYGTTVAGSNGYGTIFKITPGGTLTTLYSFCQQGGCPDGASPYAALVQASDGNLYGTTQLGGTNGDGTIFSVTQTGTLTTLHSFEGTDGSEPVAALVQATSGALYGTTASGGFNRHGTVFRITLSGGLTTLYSFCTQVGCTDGSKPRSALIEATDGNFYGTTLTGGASNSGTIFRVTRSGTLTTLYSFCSQSGCPDGRSPTALVQATDGNFYGTSAGGGAKGDGTIFNITPTGTLTTLYGFCSQSGCTDGEVPEAALVQDTNGVFYGTTANGGASAACGGFGCGTVFSLSMGLGPFVKTLPTSGKVGASVKILGTDLTGATSVTFNGTPATFVIGSANGITTTVPAGATTGPVQVVTPSGTLSSNVPFRVTQ